MTHSPTAADGPIKRRFDAGSLALSVTAVLLAGVLLLAAMRGQTVQAEMVNQTGQLTVMTADGGNEDVLLVLDGRAEQLSVYRVQNQNNLDLFKRYDLPKVFTDARAQSLGRK